MLKGMYTIEASVILTTFLMILGVFIFVAGFLHDSYVMENTAVELGIRIQEMNIEPVSETGQLEIWRLKERSGILFDIYNNQDSLDYIVEQMEELCAARTLFSDDICFTASCTYGKASVEYSARFNSPLWVMYRAFLNGRLEGEAVINYMEGNEFVRFCKGIFWR